MAIPNTSTFSMQDVRDEIGSGTSLTEFFSLATGTFDPAYVGNKDGLLNFRNYSHALSFIYEIETTSPNQVVSLPMYNLNDSLYNFTVEYGDGNIGTVTAYANAGRLHTYAAIGVYEVKITGLFDYIKFADSPASLIRILNWADAKIGDSSFYGCTNLNSIICDDLPSIYNASLANCFRNCSILNEVRNSNLWDISSVTTMSFMFYIASAFNQNISDWDTSNVTDMSSVFREATAFNQNIGGWNTSSVTGMNSMFYRASVFNQNIGSWNTSNVNDIGNMFNGAAVFNQNIGSWNTSNVNYMNYTFQGAAVFNQNISSWNIEQVISMFNILVNTVLSTANYDLLLISWESQNERSNVDFGAAPTKYTSGGAAEVARTALIANGWIITDGGPV